jgi:hypothetical protein
MAVRLIANHKVMGSNPIPALYLSILNLIDLDSFRLMARTMAFHAVNRSSILLSCMLTYIYILFIKIYQCNYIA